MSHPHPVQNWVPYGQRLLPNGYLVAAPCVNGFDNIYQGIDDNVWPIESDNYRKLADRMGIPQQLEGVQVATHWDETLAYWQRCSDQHLHARLMLISTCYLHPEVVPSMDCWRQLGYDVADPLGQHSALRHQIISGSAPQLAHWRLRLNAAGLLEKLESAEEFLFDWITVTDQKGMPPSPPFHFVPVSVAVYCTSDKRPA